MSIFSQYEQIQQSLHAKCMNGLRTIYSDQSDKKRTDVEQLRYVADIMEAVHTVNWPKLIALANEAVIDPDFRRMWISNFFILLDKDMDVFHTMPDVPEWVGYTPEQLEEKKKAEEEWDIEL